MAVGQKNLDSIRTLMVSTKHRFRRVDVDWEWRAIRFSVEARNFLFFNGIVFNLDETILAEARLGRGFFWLREDSGIRVMPWSGPAFSLPISGRVVEVIGSFDRGDVVRQFGLAKIDATQFGIEIY
jgi:hypothetical protein